jgi:hypothetical protein
VALEEMVIFAVSTARSASLANGGEFKARMNPEAVGSLPGPLLIRSLESQGAGGGRPLARGVVHDD